MTQLLYFLLVSLGVVWGWTSSSLLSQLRILMVNKLPLTLSLAYCPYCVGFWVGVGLRPVMLGLEYDWSLPPGAGGFAVVAAVLLVKALWTDAFTEGFLVDEPFLDRFKVQHADE